MKASELFGYGILFLVLYWLYQSGIFSGVLSSLFPSLSLPGGGNIPIANQTASQMQAAFPTPAAWYVAPTCNSTTPGTCPSGTVIGGVVVKP